MNYPVKNGVSQGLVSEPFMPTVDRQLARHDGRFSTMSIFNHFHQVTPLFGTQWIQTPIVKDQDIDVGDKLEQAKIPPLASCDAEFREQPAKPMIQNGQFLPARLMSERAREVTFPDTRRSGDQHIVM